jgi:NADPH:quinone reductase-like Zn-dependent oxidoreductase
MYKNIAIRPFSIYGMPENAKINAFQRIGELLATRRLTHSIDRTYAFTDMIAAHQAIETDELFGVCLVEVAQDS